MHTANGYRTGGAPASRCATATLFAITQSQRRVLSSRDRRCGTFTCGTFTCAPHSGIRTALQPMLLMGQVLSTSTRPLPHNGVTTGGLITYILVFR